MSYLPSATYAWRMALAPFKQKVGQAAIQLANEVSVMNYLGMLRGLNPAHYGDFLYVDKEKERSYFTFSNGKFEVDYDPCYVHSVDVSNPRREVTRSRLDTRPSSGK